MYWSLHYEEIDDVADSIVGGAAEAKKVHLLSNSGDSWLSVVDGWLTAR